MQGNSTATPSAFRLAERKYKFYKNPKAPLPDYSDVIDFSNPSHNTSYNQKRIYLHHSLDHEGRKVDVFTLPDKEGFYFIPGALSTQKQAVWAHRSLSEYAQPPNYSNLGLLQSNIWLDHCASNQTDQSTNSSASSLAKLRWITLGYHYNWTTNIYESTADRISPFPEEIRDLCKLHASWCGDETFDPQAGIINYYHVNSSMMKAHQDESEFTFDEPILSYCIGNSCIFLLGDVSTDITPTAIFMRSGDLMVMGGASRVFYHG